MKITDLDKHRAIKRLPEFKKDYARHNKLRTEDKITQFKIDFLKKWGYEFEVILHGDDVAKHRQDTPTVEAVTRITDAPYITIYRGEEISPSCLTGESLYLKVDLEGKTETQLVDDFKKAIKPYKNLLEAKISEETKKKRDRKTSLDMWEVYDLNLKTNKDIAETTRQRFDLKGTPAGSLYFNEPGHFNETYCKQIKAAVTHAEAIIAAVRLEFGLK